MIKKATIKEAKVLASLAIKMWSNHTITELEQDFIDIINNPNNVCFIKYIDDNPIGFVESSKRYDYVEGTRTNPVGYLEGIYILEDYRLKGYAKELLMVCEKWAKEEGCKEFASDCGLDNQDSLSFHKAMGFMEVSRIICFKKDIE